MQLYPEALLYEEAAFLAYYLHWPHNQIMGLEHHERRRWCEEVSKINKKLSGKPEKGVFDI